MADQQWDSTDNHATPQWQSTADHMVGTPANVLDNPGNVRIGTSGEGIPIYQAPQDGLRGLGESFWEGIGGKAVMDLMAGASRTPEGARRTIETAKALLNGIVGEPRRIWNELGATGQSMVNLDVPGAAYHLAGAVPLMGAPAQQVGDDFENGHYARGVGHALGLVLPLLSGATKGSLNGVTQGAAGFVKSTLNPVEQSAVNFLDSRGVPVSLGTRTGNKWVRSAEKLVEHSPLGSEAAEDFARQTEHGLRRVAGDLSDEANYYPVTPESAGASVKNALGRNVERLGLEEDAAYGQAWAGRNDPRFTEAVPVRVERSYSPNGEIAEQAVTKPVNMPVDIRDIKVQAAPLRDELQWVLSRADQSQSAAFSALEKLVQSDDYIPAWQAERGLSALKSMARTSSESGVRNFSQGTAASLIHDLQESINAAVAKTGEDAIRGLQQGRAVHASKMEVSAIADQLRKEPVQAFRQMVWEKDTGIGFLRKIADQTPDVLREIGRAYIDQLFDKATREGGYSRARGILNQWQSLGPETKKLLYPDPRLRAALDDFFKGAQMIGDRVNSSGTALVTHAASLNPMRVLAGYAGSKILFSPGGARALTQAMTQAAAGGPRAVQGLQAARSLAFRAGLSNATEQVEKQKQRRPHLSTFEK